MSFYSEFNEISTSNDKKAMIDMLMSELASIIATNRKAFTKVFDKAGVRYKPDATDVQLADIYINNINRNKTLLIGSAYLIAHHNVDYGMDGNGQIPDGAVAALSKTMNRCLSPKYSNAAGIWGEVANKALGLAQNVHGQATGADKERARQILKQQLIDNKIQQDQSKLKTEQTVKKVAIISVAILAIGVAGLILMKAIKK